MNCKKLFEEIDRLNEYYLDVLEDVCNIESPTSYKKGVDDAGNYIEKIAKEKGFKIERFSQEVSGDVIRIIMNHDAEAEPVTISGHIDTVHPVGLFGTPAVRRDEKNMYGPGVLDCKGGVIAGLLAMDALKKCGYDKRPVQLILQSDEENSSKTSNKETIKYMCETSKDSVAFLNLELYAKGYAVITTKGIIRYAFNICGTAGHSSRCDSASNAIREAAYKIIRLEEFKDAEGITCNCGVINGGTLPNVVAETCSFYADFRFTTNEELEKIKKIAKEISEKNTVEGCKCELLEVSFRPAMIDTSKNQELLDKMNKIYEEEGLPVLSPKRELAGTDAAYITQAGIPCVDGLGTEGGKLHSIDEYIELKSLSESAKRIAAVVFNI